jgi:putative transposase
MAIDSRQPSPGAITHGDHGSQFTSWVFTSRARNAGLLPSLGTVDDPYDNAVVESFKSGQAHFRHRTHSVCGHLVPA